jgi:CheY-like chemotaxis protein
VTTTLLGVDDSKTMRKVLEITFAGEDFRTVLAVNADDAMSKLHAERPSVVLVDAALDGMSGYDLCQRVKAAAPGVGVLLLSSKQQPYDRNRGTIAGADDFIDKPFDTQQLIDKVVGVLRKGATVSAPVHAQVKPASAPNAAPVPPQAVARPPTVEAVAARPRAQTLAYGSHFTPGGASAPVAPLVPPVSPVAAPQRPPAAAAAAQSHAAPQASAKSAATAAAPPYAPPQP